MLLSFAGAAASGAAYVQSSAPVSPAMPWSLTERLAALRINRGLPKAIRKQATLSLRGDHAVLKVREATGPVLLKCPLRAGLDVGDAYLSYATALRLDNENFDALYGLSIFEYYAAGIGQAGSDRAQPWIDRLEKLRTKHPDYPWARLDEWKKRIK